VRTIARVIGVDTNTLRKHYNEELADGYEHIVARLGASVIAAGLRGDWRAAVTWLARHGPREWRLPAEDRPPLSGQQQEIRAMSDEQLTAELERYRAARATAERLRGLANGTGHDMGG
jgi:hypothetical protein